MALQTEHIHQAHLQEPGIGGTMRRVATGAALGFHRYMLVDERSLLVDVALVTDRIPVWQGSPLLHRPCTMRIMAITALHQTLVDPVVIGFGKICLCRGVECVTQLRLVLN